MLAFTNPLFFARALSQNIFLACLIRRIYCVILNCWNIFSRGDRNITLISVLFLVSEILICSSVYAFCPSCVLEEKMRLSIHVHIWRRQTGLLTSLSLCTLCTAPWLLGPLLHHRRGTYSQNLYLLPLTAWSLDEPTAVRSWSFLFLPVAALSPHLKVETAFDWECKIWLGLKTVFSSYPYVMEIEHSYFT